MRVRVQWLNIVSQIILDEVKRLARCRVVNVEVWLLSEDGSQYCVVCTADHVCSNVLEKLKLVVVESLLAFFLDLSRVDTSSLDCLIVDSDRISIWRVRKCFH